MKLLQHGNPTLLHAPTGATVATTSTSGLAILDRQGYGRGRFTIIAPAATNTSGANKPLAITIQDATASGGTFGTYKVGTTATVVGTSDFTIAASGDTTGFRQTLDVDLRSANRYIRVLITPAASTSYTSLAVLAELSEGTGPGTTNVSNF